MGLYSRYVLPRLVHYTCRSNPAMRQRDKIIPRANGEVLEIGVGSGLNFSYYDPERVSGVWGLDPSAELITMAAEAAAGVPFGVELLTTGAESIPFEADRFDTLVMTYTLCSLPDPSRVLGEMLRVLRPEGRLLFCEHGLAPDDDVRRWQNRVNPLWRLIGGGCNLNRDVVELLRRGGFAIQDVDTMYIPGWRPACFNTWGSASVR